MAGGESAAYERNARRGAPTWVSTGTVTFAFTDIEGSTMRWERYPNEMARAVQRHDELLR